MYNLDTMNADELREFIRSGALIHMPQEPTPQEVEQPSERRAVEVDGLTVSIDARRLASWHAAELIARIEDDSVPDGQKMPALVELYKFVAGDDFERILDHLGGPEVASYVEVVAFVSKVLEAVGSKN